MKYQNCSLCSADCARAIFNKDKITYYYCTRCQFLFSCPENNANFENCFENYEPAYIDYLTNSGDKEKNLFYFLKWIKGFCSFEGERVLDIGAGSGKQVCFLRQRGIEAYGIEPAKALYSEFLAKEPYFFCETIEEFTETSVGGKFGVVLACDVIEHVKRPDIFFKNIFRVLAPGGWLFITTPDIRSLLAKLSGKRWHYYNKYHMSYFSKQTIVALAGHCGFDEMGFARLPRLKSLGYIMKYLNNFVMQSSCIKLPKWIENVIIPINLFDTMCVVFKRRI